MRAAVITACLAIALAACSSDGPADTSTEQTPVPSSSSSTSTSTSTEQMFPDVVGATATANGNMWTVSATLSSPYDSPARYADAWRVVGPDGTVYGERILTHDHASEQPFTRSHSGIQIPDDISTVTVQGRDLEFGYGGGTFDLVLDR